MTLINKARMVFSDQTIIQFTLECQKENAGNTNPTK